MHASYILSADDLGHFSGIFCRKPSILAADDFLGAYYRKAATAPSVAQILAENLIFSPVL